MKQMQRHRAQLNLNNSFKKFIDRTTLVEAVSGIKLDDPDKILNLRLVKYSRILCHMTKPYIPINNYFFENKAVGQLEYESRQEQKLIFMQEPQFHPILEIQRLHCILMDLIGDLFDLEEEIIGIGVELEKVLLIHEVGMVIP